jgi:hypothetical protein
MTSESQNSGAKYTFLARERIDKQVPAEMNTHATIEELPFLSNGEVNTPL